MRKHIISAASAVALLTGAAFAQTAPGNTNDPATTGSPTATSPTTTAPNATSNQATRPADTMRSDTNTEANGQRGNRASAEALMGRTVVGSDGKELGSVEDVILDANSGEARQVVISSGGFLGIGEKNIAIDFSDAELLAGQDQVRVNNLTQAQVEQMEGFDYDQDTVSLGRGGANRTTAPTTTGR